jgi:hypothetical protein
MWWPEVRLVNRIEQLLLQNGATRCQGEAIIEDGDATEPDLGV